MQSSLTNYFKQTKKRVRDEPPSKKSTSATLVLPPVPPTSAAECVTQLPVPSPALPAPPSPVAVAPVDDQIPLPLPVPVPAPSPQPTLVGTRSSTPSTPTTPPRRTAPKEFGLHLTPTKKRLFEPELTIVGTPSKTPTTPTAIRRIVPRESELHITPTKKRLRDEVSPQPSSSVAKHLALSSPMRSGHRADGFELPVPISVSQEDHVALDAESIAAASPLMRSPTKECPLALPYKFKVLEELFHALETVASIFHNRGETMTFEKAQPGVHEIMRRLQLKKRHVEQMLTIFPDAYTVELDKHKTTTMSGVQKVTYQLIMAINLKCTCETVQADTLTAAMVSERRRIFHENLLQICHKHHQEFLGTLQPPIKIPSHKKVTRWHPRFRLDQIPDIEPEKKLPTPPEPAASANNAKDVLAKARNILDNANPAMKKALAELLKAKTKTAQEQAAPKQKATPTPTSSAQIIPTTQSQDNKTKPSKPTISALKGVSQGLIDKIRAREQEKAIREMTLTPEENQNNIMLNRLPDFVKSVRNILVAEKKSAMSLRLLVDRLCHSKDGALTAHEIEDHVRLMSTVLPTWVSILKLSQGEYVKINKDTNINSLLEKFSERLKSLKNSK